MAVALTLDPALRTLLGELPVGEIDSQEFFASCELLHLYAGEHALGLADALKLGELLASPLGAAALLEKLGAPERFLPALEWLLQRLTEDGYLAFDATDQTWTLVRPLRTPRLEEVRAAALDNDPRNAPTLDLDDAAARAWLEVAADRTTGQAALLGLGQTNLWLQYFSNDNPSYAISNLITAVAVANRLPDHPARVLEVGAGGGSASGRLLSKLERRGQLDRIASYTLTEPSPFFRRRAERDLRSRFPSIPIEARSLDVDGDWVHQGIEPGSYDVIFGVNVFHVAKRLSAALESARTSLVPGGVVVAGECIRPFEGQTIPAELVFRILDDFNDVELDPTLRPHPGFLAPERWAALFHRAGLEGIEIVPDPFPIRTIYPRFFAGAIAGRAPGGTQP
jgi:SAM-dependent methyltransferase